MTSDFAHFTPDKVGRLNALAKAATLVEGTHLRRESELMTTKWFAYRFMSPIEATMLFARTYLSQRKAYVRMNIDMNSVHLVGGASTDIPAGPTRAFTQLWVARQRADELGVPYEPYLEFCFSFAGRRNNRKAPPMPNQLHANEHTRLAWFAEFEKFIEGRLFFAALNLDDVPQYDVRAYRALPAQIAVRQFITNQMIQNPAPWSQQIERWSINRRLFPVPEFKKLIQADVLKSIVDVVRASALLSSAKDPFVQPANETFWQSCFGVPGAQNQTCSPCSDCTQSVDCASMAGLVMRKIEPITKGLDPVLLKRREASRRRTAKSRSKAREVQAVPDSLSATK